MKASEVIKKLKEIIEEHGDCEVYSGGEDYPGVVHQIAVVKHGNGYTPSGAIQIHARGY